MTTQISKYMGKITEYGLHPEDVDAITRDSANPDLMKLGLALRARGLSIKEQNQIAARVFHLLTVGDDSRLGAAQAAVGEIKHQLLGQEILCKTFDNLL